MLHIAFYRVEYVSIMQTAKSVYGVLRTLICYLMDHQRFRISSHKVVESKANMSYAVLSGQIGFWCGIFSGDGSIRLMDYFLISGDTKMKKS